MIYRLENQIILTSIEAERFRRSIDAPDPVAIARRDATLNWVANHMDLRTTPQGFCVTILDKEEEA